MTQNDIKQHWVVSCTIYYLRSRSSEMSTSNVEKLKRTFSNEESNAVSKITIRRESRKWKALSSTSQIAVGRSPASPAPAAINGDSKCKGTSI